ncbi:hypothetical protein B0H67DRAFT_599053 [Lasiosphaeris hirsuta]|uniref:Uncharacterized protein n=1 Tax=Lasiosphaeris hirsuta TaxID=260670 RepID=A0AA40DXD7_9PEZI|nr:hypothetical protein B0H67DRAFT_599053 [Lasiosphaeris hirsuta]
MDEFYQSLGVGDPVVANIKQHVQAGENLLDALRLVQAGPGVDGASRQRLLLATDIFEISGKDRSLCLLLLKDREVKTLSDVAIKYYSAKDEVPGITAIRSELLYRVPTAVLSAVVDHTILELDPSVRDSVSRILKLAVVEQFDVRSGTLGQFIARPACQDELSSLSVQDAQDVRRTLEALFRLHSLVIDAQDLKALVGTRFTSARVIACSDQDEFVQQLEARGLSSATAARIYLEARRIDRRNDAFWADIVRARREVPVLAISGPNQASSPSPSDDDQDTNLTTLFNDLDSVAADNSTSVLGPASYLVDLLKMLGGVDLSIKTADAWTVENATSALDVFLHRRPDIASAHLSKDLTIEPNGDPNANIYATISKQLAPMVSFPYNHAIATSRELLQARGYTRYELLRRFQFDQDLVLRAFPGSSAGDRTYAAAARSLQPLDFLAITGEAFHSPAFVRLLQGYDAEVGPKTYRDADPGADEDDDEDEEDHGDDANAAKAATWKMANSASKTSLRLVKDQLLVRSGLSPSDLNTVLKTRYIGKRLVDMRLQESPLRTCLDLQAFLRLHHRLGWSIETTDAAIAVLARRAQVYDDDAYRHYVLDGGFIERLAAARQLSTRMDVPLMELLPLWGPMDAQFPSSFYPKLFLRPQLVQQYPSLSLIDGETLPTAKFGQNLGALIQALRLTQANLLTRWNMESIAQLYSHQQMSKLLNLPVSRYAEWWRHCQQVANPFLDPQSTLAALELWVHLPEEISSVEAALDLLAPVDSDQQQPGAKDLAFISQTVQGVAEVESQYAPFLTANISDVEEAQIFTGEALLAMCSRVLGPGVSKAVVEVMEGRSASNSGILRIFSAHFRLQEPEVTVEFLKPLVSGVSEVQKREDEVRSRRKKAIFWMIPELKRRGMEAAVQTALAVRFPGANPELLQAFLSSKAPSGESSYRDNLNRVWGNIQAWLHRVEPIGERTYFFPPATAEYTFASSGSAGKLIIDHQTADFVAGAPKLVTRPVSLNQRQPSSLEFSDGLSLQDLTYSTPKGEASFDEPSVCPASLAETASHEMSCLERCLSTAGTLGLSPQEVDFHRQRGVDFSDLKLGQMRTLFAFLRTRKQFGVVSGASLVSYCQYLERASSAANPAGNDEQAQAEEEKEAAQLLTETRQLTRLTAENISAFFDAQWPATSTSQRAKNLMALDLSPLQQLADCCEMSSSLAVPISMLHQWAQVSHSPKKPEDFDSLEQLKPSLSSGNAVNALSRARESLASTQQRVLQDALLRVPAFQARKITTADALSAELLIDVKMGPAMQTSRIAQAIASVQLFVQRCLLGLEKAYGVPTTGIKQPLWSWMSKYTLWQANRKVFLYPENWADPSLRDDKTQAFEELESKMLQMNLNKDVIGQLLREYVYAAHEVADLDVQSYLWEATRGFRGAYHFFARTRTAPFDFYYRRLEVTGASAASIWWNWLPWSKMEVEIPTHEVDADHQPLQRPGSYLLPALFKNRLFLFIPQITRQTKPSTAPKMAMMEAAKDGSESRPPEQYWEVKMAWVEMRNGKWSPKYVTATGINVEAPKPPPPPPPPQPGSPAGASPTEFMPVLPSIASFRFRLETRDSGRSLAINVDKWKQEAGAPAVMGSFEKQGRFEMQGLRLRLVEASPGSAVGSSIAGKTSFSRVSHTETTKDGEQLRRRVEGYALGIDPKTAQKSLLTVPNPKNLVGDEYELTWLLTYDDSQFNGTSGLVVERSTPLQVQTFFGYPDMTVDGEIDTTNKITVTTHPLTHETSLRLVEEISNKEGYECIFDALESLPQNMHNLAFGFDSATYSELATPCSVYNWEMGFHTVSLLVERLSATQQFDLAIDVSRLVFDPVRDDANAGEAGLGLGPSAKPLKPLSRLDRCWRFIPFKSSGLRLAGSVRDTIQRLAPGESKSSDIADWEANPFSPHAVARNRPAVYMKRFVMKCIEILIASGDQYFRQNSSEAVPLATQRYVEASELFGPAPVAIDPPTEPVTKSYAEIRHLVNDFATASVDMELAFPYFTNPAARGGGARGPPREKSPELRDGTLGFVRSTYFSVPANPQMQALRDLIDDRLQKIRNGLDINGNPRRLPLFDAPLDPGQLIAALGSGESLARFAEGADGGPMPNYRARYLLQKALEICGELRAFSDSYLSIRERRDAEALASLRARQEGGVLSLMSEVKRLQVQEATTAVDALEETRQSHVSRLQYYLALMGESTDRVPTPQTEWVDLDFGIVQPNKDELRMSQEEWLEWALTDEAKHSNHVATGIEQNAGLLMALPNLIIQVEPMGVGTSSQVDASIVAKSMMANAGVIRAAAQASSEMAFRASRKGQLIRQLQERKLQANMAGRDIKGIDRQIASQKKRIDIARAEQRAHQQQVADTAETEAWLRSKYTSDKLYSWLEVETRKLAYQTYLSALDMARTAERATMFEYGPRAQPVLSNAYWDESRDGLLSAQQLTAALHRIDRFSIQNTAHDYELTKTISLRHIDPLALVDLRTKGAADFAIPEVLFDHDFPGHYCRRIKSISVSIPSIVGPYTGIHCTLRLLEHRYRLRPGLSSAGSYYLPDASDDARFHTDRVPLSSVALSTCSRDSGAFELRFDGDRYVPFEGAGAISRWALELPAPFPQFDYRTISDVVLAVQYTALEGGAGWRALASDAVRAFRGELKADLGHEGALLLVDLQADFPVEWRRLSAQIAAAETPEERDKPVVMSLDRIPDLLPFWSVGQDVAVQKVWMALQPGADDGWGRETGEVKVLGMDVVEDVGKSGKELKVMGSSEGLGRALKEMALEVRIAPARVKGVTPKGWWLVLQYTQGA